MYRDFFLTLLAYHIDVAVLVSAVEQSDSVIHIHISMSTLFQISFPYRSSQSPECSSRYCTVGSLQLSILHIQVHICQSQFPNLSHRPPFPWSPYTCSLFLCLYFCFEKYVHFYCISRFHMQAMLYNICFSLYGLLHSA